MFTLQDRERTQELLLSRARADERITAAAVVGSRAITPGDRWSDLDLSFAVKDGLRLDEVLSDWSEYLEKELAALHLFDLRARQSTYRVFLLPGALQVDLSFTPAADFRPYGPSFRLLYGVAGTPDPFLPPDPRELLGRAVHHAVHARTCIERGRFWQAEHWLSKLREHTLSLACLARGLDPSNGRGFDALPQDLLSVAEGTLIGTVERGALDRALGACIECLLSESGGPGELAARAAPLLHELR